MSDPCCGQVRPATPVVPWWQQIGIVLPIVSALAFGAGLFAQWLGASQAATLAYWIGLLAGGATFAPASLRNLVRTGKASIGLLMTISATGAVILGYVHEAAALAFLYSVAEALEDAAMDRAHGQLRALLRLVPQTATVQRNDLLTTVDVADIGVGELLVVKPGERIATDGILRQGPASLDTSAITGESIPAEVDAGDPVPAGAISTDAAIDVTTTAPGADNSLTEIVRIVEQAQERKGRRARLADAIARPLVPGVIVLALAVGVIGSLIGDPDTWITRALVVLVAASPCALAISVPVTVVSAIGAASRFGVVITSGAAFEALGSIARVAFDKTGTLTTNRPAVTAVRNTDDFSTDHVLTWAAAIEQYSSHPLAAAIVNAASAAASTGVSEVVEQRGLGVTGVVHGHQIAVGNTRWLDAGNLADDVSRLEASGHTCMIVTHDGRAAGVIAIRDELRPEARATIDALHGDGISTMLLTGDNDRTAVALADTAGIDNVHARLRPEEKATVIGASAQEQATAMIGDGINDAPALATATVGIAMGASGSDAAIESADIAFTGHDLRLIPAALRHARRARAIMNQNIAISLLIIATLIPLAMSGVLGLGLVVLIHETAEVVVIANGLRAARTQTSSAQLSLTHRSHSAYASVR